MSGSARGISSSLLPQAYHRLQERFFFSFALGAIRTMNLAVIHGGGFQMGQIPEGVGPRM